MNHYKTFAQKFIELDLNINNSNQFNIAAKELPENVFNYLKIQISQHGINHVIRTTKEELNNL